MAQISAHSIKMKFPEFTDVPSTQIEFAIEEAALNVDSTWGTRQVLGLLYWTAHILMFAISRAASGTGQQIASESFAGVMSITYQNAPPLDADQDDLSATPYGLRVRALMEAQFPAVAII